MYQYEIIKTVRDNGEISLCITAHVGDNHIQVGVINASVKPDNITIDDVRSDLLRHGVGSKLLKVLEGEVKELNMPMYGWLNPCDDWDILNKFYDKNGYTFMRNGEVYHDEMLIHGSVIRTDEITIRKHPDDIRARGDEDIVYFIDNKYHCKCGMKIIEKNYYKHLEALTHITRMEKLRL